MILSTNTSDAEKTLGHLEAIRLLAKAGFDALDWSFYGASMEEDGIWMGTSWRDRVKEMLEVADCCGISFNQAHAPFVGGCNGTDPYDEAYMKKIHRAMEAAALLGAKQIVVHPKQHLPYLSNKQELFRASVEFYQQLIPYCEEYGIRVCSENMWQKDKVRGVIIDSVCSQPEEFCEMLDTVDSPWITGCLDVGHAALVSVDPAHFIRVMGKKRLSALHIHDVDKWDDRHHLPFMERMDWTAITQALGEIDYQGEFTFEVHFLEKLPRALWNVGAKFMEQTGRYLIAEVEANRK